MAGKNHTCRRRDGSGSWLEPGVVLMRRLSASGRRFSLFAMMNGELVAITETAMHFEPWTVWVFFGYATGREFVCADADRGPFPLHSLPVQGSSGICSVEFYQAVRSLTCVLPIGTSG